MAQIQLGFFKFSVARLLRLVLLAAIVFILVQTPQVLLAQSIPQHWATKEYQPPDDIGEPVRVEGGGTRGSQSSCSITDKPLKALLPSNRFGVTVAAYPTFFVYMPALSLQTAPLVEFVLGDKDDNTIYKSTFRTSGRPGIITLSLPIQGGLSPLEIGKDYKWSFSILCQPDERSRDMAVEGWVRRIELNPTLKTQLAQASLQQQVDLYANAEIWYDSLATLVQLRRKNPSDVVLAGKWAKLLSSVGLDTIAQEGLVPTPTTARVPVQ